MLLANKKVSEFVSLNKKKGTNRNTFIYRIHDDPDPATEITSGICLHFRIQNGFGKY
jgi:exoribonuclease R